MRYELIRRYVEEAYKRQGLTVDNHIVDAEQCISDIMIAAERISTDSINRLKVGLR